MKVLKVSVTFPDDVRVLGDRGIEASNPKSRKIPPLPFHYSRRNKRG